MARDPLMDIIAAEPGLEAPAIDPIMLLTGGLSGIRSLRGLLKPKVAVSPLEEVISNRGMIVRGKAIEPEVAYHPLNDEWANLKEYTPEMFVKDNPGMWTIEQAEKIARNDPLARLQRARAKLND